MLAVTDWNPLVVAVAAFAAALAGAIPAVVGVVMAWMEFKKKMVEQDHKLKEMQITGLKTLHHVNSGTVFAAQAAEVNTGLLVEAKPTEVNRAKHKQAILNLERAIATQNETADLLIKMGSEKVIPPTTSQGPLEVVLTTTSVKGTDEQVATKQDVEDALKKGKK